MTKTYLCFQVFINGRSKGGGGGGLGVLIDPLKSVHLLYQRRKSKIHVHMNNQISPPRFLSVHVNFILKYSVMPAFYPKKKKTVYL